MRCLASVLPGAELSSGKHLCEKKLPDQELQQNFFHAVKTDLIGLSQPNLASEEEGC